MLIAISIPKFPRYLVVINLDLRESFKLDAVKLFEVPRRHEGGRIGLPRPLLCNPSYYARK